MDWLDYLIEHIAEILIALLVAALIAYMIGTMAARATRVVACMAALVLITGILYAAFEAGVSVFSSGATAALSSLDSVSGGNMSALAAAIMPGNLQTCISALLALMVARLIYDWNVDLIKTLCG